MKLTGNIRKRVPVVITINTQGEVHFTKGDRKHTWKDYIKHLFQNESTSEK